MNKHLTTAAISNVSSIYIADIEAAINYLRKKRAPTDGLALAPQLRDLVEIYALMGFRQQEYVDAAVLQRSSAWQAWQDWYDTTPDTPCIAICSTSQGDEVCKGCGRTFDEVQRWLAMSPVEKRITWRRITQQATAWRFGLYAHRAIEPKAESP